MYTIRKCHYVTLVVTLLCILLYSLLNGLDMSASCEERGKIISVSDGTDLLKKGSNWQFCTCNGQAVSVSVFLLC